MMQVEQRNELNRMSMKGVLLSINNQQSTINNRQSAIDNSRRSSL